MLFRFWSDFVNPETYFFMGNNRYNKKKAVCCYGENGKGVVIKYEGTEYNYFHGRNYKKAKAGGDSGGRKSV